MRHYFFRLTLVMLRCCYADDTPGNLPSYQIGKQDLLSVSVYGSPEFSKQVRVSDDGSIQLPLMSHRIVVAGLMLPDLQQRIAAELERERLLVKPLVTVTIAEYPNFSLHSLRHSHASILLRNGTPLAVVSERLGHANQDITLGLYSHSLPADRKTASRVWHAALAEVISEGRLRRAG